MNILLVSHASFEGPGSIEDWAKRNNHHMQEVNPYAGESLPSIDQYDMLVVMGGPQSPLEIGDSPYLKDEMELIKLALNKNKPMIGVCLGAQLISEALGGKTERSPNKEVGMYPLELLSKATSDPVFSHFPATFDVMHWHNDMPGVVDGIEILAKSEGCPRQVFRFGDRVYGLQCHFELTNPLVERMITHSEGDLKPGQYVMTPEQLMSLDFSEMNARLDKVLDYLAGIHS